MVNISHKRVTFSPLILLHQQITSVTKHWFCLGDLLRLETPWSLWKSQLSVYFKARVTQIYYNLSCLSFVVRLYYLIIPNNNLSCIISFRAPCFLWSPPYSVNLSGGWNIVRVVVDPSDVPSIFESIMTSRHHVPQTTPETKHGNRNFFN